MEVQSSPGARLVRDPLRRIKGGLQSSTTSSTDLHPPSGTKWINLPSPLHLLKKYHGERVNRGHRVRKVVLVWIENMFFCFSRPKL